MSTIRENILEIRARMDAAARAAGRAPAEILLCAASKMNDAGCHCISSSSILRAACFIALRLPHVIIATKSAPSSMSSWRCVWRFSS